MAKQASTDVKVCAGEAREALHVDIFWEAGCLGGPALAAADVLRVMNAIAALQSPGRPAPMRWRWVRGSGRPVSGSALGALPAAEATAQDARTDSSRSRAMAARVIIVPGWLARDGPEVDRSVARAQAWLPRLRRTLEHGGAVLGAYTGVALLAAAGCLQGRRVSAPWPFMAAVLRQATRPAAPAAPAVEWSDAPSWTRDCGVWTCASPASVTEALLDLLDHTPFAALARSARDVLLPSAMRQGAAVAHARAAGASLATSRVPAGIVERARQWLVDHLAEPYDAVALARAAATSPRTLVRHFEATHGMTPHRYLERLRVERACLLLQTTYLTAEEIGRASGLPHPSTFRRVFVRHTGQRPGDFRQRHRLRTRRPRWGGAAPDPTRPP